MTDRMSKTLLIMIAIGLWGVLLRPLFIPTPARAQDFSDEAATPPAAPEKGAAVTTIKPGEKVLVVDSQHVAAYTLDANNKIILLDNENWYNVKQAAKLTKTTKTKAK